MGRPPDCHCHCGNEEGGGGGSDNCPFEPGWRSQFVGSDKMLVIQVCNTNSYPDDVFSVLLNGSTLDSSLDLGSSSKVGKIYRSVGGVNQAISDWDPLLICPGQSHPQTTFNASLLIDPSPNVISSTQVVDNAAGNFGQIRVISYDLPYVYGQGHIIGDFDYSDAPWNASFSLCESPYLVTASYNGVINYAYTIRVSPGYVQLSYGDSQVYTPGDTLRFYLESYSTSFTATRLVFGNWIYKEGNGPWTDSGHHILNMNNYIRTMPSDILEIYPNIYNVMA